MRLNIRNDIFYIKQDKKSKNIQENPIIVTNAKNLVDGMKHEQNKPAGDNRLAVEDVREIRFSNNTRDACKAMCLICKRPVFLTTMRTHTRARHNLTIEEYRQEYGDHRDKIIEKVYHKCGICLAIILLDSDDVAKHLRRHHSITHRRYNEEYMATRNSDRAEQGKGESSVKNVDVCDEMKDVGEDENSREKEGKQKENIKAFDRIQNLDLIANKEFKNKIDDSVSGVRDITSEPAPEENDDVEALLNDDDEMMALHEDDDLVSTQQRKKILNSLDADELVALQDDIMALLEDDDATTMQEDDDLMTLQENDELRKHGENDKMLKLHENDEIFSLQEDDVVMTQQEDDGMMTPEENDKIMSKTEDYEMSTLQKDKDMNYKNMSTDELISQIYLVLTS